MHIPGFESFDFDHGGIRHPVFCQGQGPGVILMHELPGLSCPCIRLADRIARHGFRVYMPLFFGKPGEHALFKNTVRVCVSREFHVFATRRSSPVSECLLKSACTSR